VNRLGNGLKMLKSTIGEDMSDLDSRLLNVEAELGSQPRDSVLENCASVWDGLTFLASQIEDVAKDHVLTKDTITAALDAVDGRVARAIDSKVNARQSKWEKSTKIWKRA
jgi:hypothetical protein